MATTPKLGITYLEENQTGGETVANDAFNEFESVVQLSIINVQSAPPGSPADGDIYILDSSPSGDWSTFGQHDVAAYYSGWVAFTPEEGWIAWRQDDDYFMRFDGTSWIDMYGAASVETSFTASTTQTQGQGALTASYNRIATVANANDTVTLPEAAAGRQIVVENSGANTLQIFPASGDNISDNGLNTAVTVAAGNTAIFFGINGVNWISISGAIAS